MKKVLLTLAITTALYGCGESLEDVKNESEVIAPARTAATVAFDPSNGVVSVPNDLLFLGTTDGTLNMPGEAAEEINYADPQTALGALDGWSTQSPYQIALDVPAGLVLDTSTVNGDSVRLFEVVMGASITDTECAQVQAGLACKYVKELTFGVDFVAQASGNNIAIVPLKPFNQGSAYINVVTKALRDTSGESFEPSETYGLVKLDIESLPLVTDEQKALQGVINSYENIVTQSGSLTKDDIIYTGAMSIQSAGSVMSMVKNMYAMSAATKQNMPQLMMGPSTGMTVGDVLFRSQGAQPPSPVFDQIKYERGSVVLPHYLRKPQGTDDSALNDTYWKALCDGAATLAGFVANGGYIPEQPAEGKDTICFNASNGLLRDLGLDEQRHLTKYNPLPYPQSYANVPVQVTTPAEDLTVINAVRAQLGMPALAMPATGWPVVMLQHGITSTKESMLAITAALTLQGFVTVAIDHPLHGERGIDANDDGTVDFLASGDDGNVLHYMNLSSSLVARDNLRQSMADLLGLRLSLAATNLQGINPTDVSFVGHSLGAVVAPGFLAAANESVAPLVGPETAALIDPLFKVNTAALASGSGGLAGFLLESNAFGNVIKGSVLAGAGTAESAEFIAFMSSDEGKAACADYAGSQSEFAGCAFVAYTTMLAQAEETEKLANISGTISQFAFAIQTAVDAADSNSLASKVVSQGTAIYQNVVIGDGAGNPADTVIPPYSTINPVSGTVPSGMLMGLTPVATSQMTETPNSYLVKFTKGHHGSVLTPAPAYGVTAADAAAANAEMQSQIASFLASRGLMLQVTNTTVVTE
ncbi:Extracellular lipase precursor [Pseudoalteromonas sp. P1-9]|uniref:VolA/Pla-1 family phospholipase n=1 Tax=Pseudoalteromonas sp. P1-9 TaxID=1710354 RepID=UPI0006D5F43F|nr:VolA/Pla-1 family phospholipase [Pseudoalteromonas sp. P1-9]KPV94927.1 Extracellular lipase precursor [Pseudoalteromonas sp. P1-9]